MHDTPKAHYQQLYYEALVNTISCLKDQFNQPGYNIYCNLEELLMKASMKEDFNELFRSFCDFYQKDFYQKDSWWSKSDIVALR